MKSTWLFVTITVAALGFMLADADERQGNSAESCGGDEPCGARYDPPVVDEETYQSDECKKGWAKLPYLYGKDVAAAVLELVNNGLKAGHIHLMYKHDSRFNSLKNKVYNWQYEVNEDETKCIRRNATVDLWIIVVL